VLVVDDHPDVRDVLARTLRKEGWTVDEANGGEAALSYLARHTPDVIVLDLLMPGVDGFTVIDRLSANPAWADIPVLVVTAKDLTPADRSRLQGGVESVVQKSGRTLEQVVHELSGVLHTSLPSDAPPGR
jgi:CheY-like chemotaxis protein